MGCIAIDLGGTKLASAYFTPSGEIRENHTHKIGSRRGNEVGELILEVLQDQIGYARDRSEPVEGIGISVPGIYNAGRGTVWAPNIAEWEDYPLLSRLESHPALRGRPLRIDSDRACYILGECWKGAAAGCRDAVFIAVGTGIGAGILNGGRILRGHSNIAGAVGWMALERPYDSRYGSCGQFEYYASGEGLARHARDLLETDAGYQGKLSQKPLENLTSRDIFEAHADGDTLALRVLDKAITMWGMAAANMISIFNPEMILFGGGVFGPAASLIEIIREEAFRWAQPVSANEVSITVSALGSEAGLYGAGFLGLNKEL